jgi:hypothetical protein
MAGRECYHCKSWIEEGTPHDCWSTTEAALTRDLPDDLLEAWERLRESAAELGDQRIYASLNSIMFSRKTCYTFVRPKRKYLEVCIFLRRTQQSPLVHKAMPASKTKVAHMIRVTHRDQIEAPITDWLKEAYDTVDLAMPAPKAVPVRRAGPAKRTRRALTAPRKKASGKARKKR